MNVYQKVTDAIIAQLEQGFVPWHRSYVGGVSSEPINYMTRKPYQGVNRFLLTRPGEYLTFNQVQSLGGHVKAGAKAEFAIFFKHIEKDVIIDGEEVDEGFPIIRYYNLFHISDVEGVPSKMEVESAPGVAQHVTNIDYSVESYLTREGITVEHSTCATPTFNPERDAVLLPTMEQYKSTEDYYGDYLHELIHSTGTEGRLARGVETSVKGSAEYAREELVAEIGSAMAASVLGIESDDSIRSNAAYIKSWISKLREDSKMVVWAAAKAEKAVDYIFRWNLAGAAE